MTRILMFPSDVKTMAMKATCHFTEEEMAMPKNDRKKMERVRKKEAFSIIDMVMNEISIR